MLRIGLTGGIASGKSTVANLFAARGATVLDTDVIAREVVEPGRPALGALVSAQGAGILDGAGRLDRAELRRRLFEDAATRRDVEAILHPAILAELERQARAGAAAPTRCSSSRCWWRTGLERIVDRVLVVDCSEEEQVRRLVARDGEEPGIGPADAGRPGDPRAAPRRRRTTSIDNGGPAADLPAQVAALDLKYRGLAATP